MEQGGDVIESRHKLNSKREQGQDDIESGNKLYSKRALLGDTNKTVKLSGNSLEAGTILLITPIQISMKQLISNDELRPLPNAYYCPITFWFDSLSGD